MPPASGILDQTFTVRVLNHLSTEIQFYVEPWGNALAMASGMIFEIVATGPQGGKLEIVFKEDSIEAWGWEGSSIQVFHEQKLLGGPYLGELPRAPAPPIPPPVVGHSSKAGAE